MLQPNPVDRPARSTFVVVLALITGIALWLIVDMVARPKAHASPDPELQAWVVKYAQPGTPRLVPDELQEFYRRDCYYEGRLCSLWWLSGRVVIAPRRT